MGAINYGTNSILCSLGYYNTTLDTSEEAIKEYREEFDLSEEDYSDSEIAEKIYEDEAIFASDEMNEVERGLSNYEYFDVSVECGYYEGFYISIDEKYLYLDTYQDKILMQKELTRLKNDLIYCIENCGVRVCYPGWCTDWEESIEDSIAVLEASVKEERRRIKNLRTEKQFWKLSQKERNEIYGLCF